MTRRNPPAKWVLPTVIDPPCRRCFIIEVPDEPYHLAAFRGALLNLAAAYKWADDPAHTARAVALVWRSVIDKMRNCEPDASNDCLIDIGEDMLIRQNPDNPCIIETSADNIHWCTVADISLCLGIGPQPGAGAEQPAPGGGCVTYHALVYGNGLWYLPTVVNAGDVITVSAADGATNDGGTPAWRCPSGQQFFAGTCNGSGIPAISGDPLMTANHLRLIVNIDGTFYDAVGGAVTVPGGVSNAQVFFQVNDSDLSNNAGSITFDVQVCNNQTVTFVHTFDFLTSDGGFVPGWDINARAFGVWTGGVGWESELETAPDDYTIIIQRFTAAAHTITRIDATVVFTVANVNRNTVAAVGSTLGTSGIGTAAESYSTTFPGGTSADNVAIGIGSGGNAFPEGPFKLISMTVYGIGPDPY